MKIKILLIVFIIINALAVFAGNEINETRIVNADPSLRIRDKPDLNAKTIGSIPNGEEVLLTEEAGNEITISGATGKWSRVKWKELTGWVFGGFLSEANPLSDEILSQQIYGYWDYAENGSMGGFSFDPNIVREEWPMGGTGTWRLEDNSIFIDIDCVLRDPGGGDPVHIQSSYELFIKEFHGNSMLVIEIRNNRSGTPFKLYKKE